MRLRFLLGTALALALGVHAHAQSVNPSGGGGGAPSGPAGGSLAGTYPNPTVATNANLTGPITSTGNATAIASQTGTGSTFVVQTGPTLTTPTLGVATATSINGVTIPSATDTVDLLGTVQTITATKTFSAASAASTPAMLFTGALFTGGSGSSTEPHVLIQPSTATASSTWSTSGTAFGVNAHTGVGNLIDLQLDGTSDFLVNAAGSIIVPGSVQAGAAGVIRFNGRGVVTSPGVGQIQIGSVDVAAPVAQTISMQNVVAGNTNTAGANAIIQGSLSNGTGVGGTITFKTSASTAGSGVQNTGLVAGLFDTTQHFIPGDTAANPPTCGAGCTSIAAGSSDQRMTVTTSSAVTSITVNFGKTWPETPVCLSETNSATNLSAITAVSATAVTVTVAVALTTQPLYMQCM